MQLRKILIAIAAFACTTIGCAFLIVKGPSMLGTASAQASSAYQQGSLKALPADAYKIVETRETIALTPQPATPRTFFHNCNPQPELPALDCWWEASIDPPTPVVNCPEGQTLDYECKTACWGAWLTATSHARYDYHDARQACCENFNTILASMNADYASDIADAEAAFAACTKSPARCEADYCTAIAAAYAAYATTYSQLVSDYYVCTGIADLDFAVATYSAGIAYQNCMAACCH